MAGLLASDGPNVSPRVKAREHRPRPAIDSGKEIPMSQPEIDPNPQTPPPPPAPPGIPAGTPTEIPPGAPAEFPEDNPPGGGPEIAADDAGASGMAEEAQKEAGR
jgi:hypothetical protein